MKLIQEYRLYGIFHYVCNDSVFNFLNLMYPNRWTPFDMPKVSNGYWKEKDNCVNAIRYLVYEKLNLKSREDILNLRNEDFEKLGAMGIFKYFNNSIYETLCASFPELDIYPWEMNSVKLGFWKDKNNRIDAMKWLIEKELSLKLEEVPSVISESFLTKFYPRFTGILKKYYKNIYEWINEVYRNRFTPEDFNLLIAKDGTKVSSEEELLIHNCFIDNYSDLDVKYIGTIHSKEYSWENIKENETYFPDWLINNYIIVEHFGLYYPNRNTEFLISYAEKTHRKIEFYNELCKNDPKYKFICFFPDDLNNSLYNVKQKLNNELFEQVSI